MKKVNAGACESTAKISITDGALRIVEEVVASTQSSDRMELLSYVCDSLEKKYSSGRLERHLSQMNLSTTEDVLKAIDMFFIMRRMYPDFTMSKKSAV